MSTLEKERIEELDASLSVQEALNHLMLFASDKNVRQGEGRRVIVMLSHDTGYNQAELALYFEGQLLIDAVQTSREAIPYTMAAAFYGMTPDDFYNYCQERTALFYHRREQAQVPQPSAPVQSSASGGFAYESDEDYLQDVEEETQLGGRGA